MLKKINKKMSDLTTKTVFSQASDTSETHNTAKNNEKRLALDIFETEETLFIVAPLAGVDPEELEVSIDEDILTIKGERKFPENLPQVDSFFTEECFWGTFSRSVVLPSAINSADIKAKMNKNVLAIAVPKARKTKTKIVSIDLS